jgi:putative nucleotidyltransferase with HDIG domain
MENWQADSAGVIAVVDDSVAICRYLSMLLTRRGYCCVTFTGAQSLLVHLALGERKPALIFSDINMPGMNGLELLKAVRAKRPDLPFILLSGAYEEALALEALREGATDYLLKPATPDVIVELVQKHLVPMRGRKAEVRRALAYCVENLRLSGGDPATLLVPLFDLLGLRRFETLQHSQRVAAYALLIADALGLPEHELCTLEIGALLHDIGKAAIPRNVLMKTGPLNEEEWRVMRMHPRIGFELISSIPGAARESEIAYCHHECMDGSGYPRGLAGEQIPLNARIFAVADTLDAICSDRSYRRGSSVAKARAEIARVAGAQFDSEVVAALGRVADADLAEVRARFPDAGMSFHDQQSFTESLAALRGLPALTMPDTVAKLVT